MDIKYKLRISLMTHHHIIQVAHHLKQRLGISHYNIYVNPKDRVSLFAKKKRIG
jgi:hypothetical protein